MAQAPTRGRGQSRIGVVIPARDEEATIGPCLESLGPFRRAVDPIIVVDDGSRDSTAKIAHRRGASVLTGTGGGRGRAVAAGYEAVARRVDIVLVVHADMRLPAEARERILEATDRDPGAVGGCLGHRIADPRRRFRWIEAGNRFRARRWQLPYGDQAQFVRTSAVEASGGFPVLERMEDLELSLRLRKLGRWIYLDCPVVIPSRHWRRGIVISTLRNWTLALLYRLGRPSAGSSSSRRGPGDSPAKRPEAT